MIKIENIEVFGWKAAIHGMRNPMNSWDKSDSFFCTGDKCFYMNGCKNPQYNDNLDSCPLRQFDEKGYNRYIQMEGGFGAYIVGINDLKLMQSLIRAGTDHSKFMRMINVTMDITAPMYFNKEFDTYKVGTVRNSCSTMHKIHSKEFTLDDFSHEHLIPICKENLNNTIKLLNQYRDMYIHYDEICSSLPPINYIPSRKEVWWQMIQLLPSSYNQKFTWQANYQVLRNIYFSRRSHKLDEWIDFCRVIEELPYGNELICLEE